MREWEKADIKFEVCLKDCEESNLFLRKFYDEISKYIKVAWNFQPHRKERVIYVGMATFGEMWIEYVQKGRISKVYIKTDSEESKKQIEEALACAKRNHTDMKEYRITAVFNTEDVSFCSMCKNGIQVKSVNSDI